MPGSGFQVQLPAFAFGITAVNGISNVPALLDPMSYTPERK
jgi:hypothetical protein